MAENFEVKISTPVDLSGAGQAAAELDKVKDSAKKAGEAAHEGGISHKELHESIKLTALAAGDALGSIGELGHFLGSPELLGVAGAVLAFKMLTDQLTASREAALKQLEAFTQFHDFLASNHQRAMLDSSAQMHAWNLQLEHARDNVDRLTQAMERNITRGHDSLRNTTDLISAQERLAESIIHAREASGQTTPAGASEEMRQAQRAAQHARDQAEDQEARADIAAKRDRASSAAGESAIASSRLAGSNVDRGLNDEALGLADNRVQEARKASEEATKAADEARNNLTHPTLSGSDAARALTDPMFVATKFAEMADEAKTTADTAKAKKEELETAIKHKAQLEDQKATIDDDIKSQQELITSRNALRDKLNEEADAADEALRTRQTGRAQVEAMDRQTDAVNRGSANIETVRRVESGGGTAAEAAQVETWHRQAALAQEDDPQLGYNVSSALDRGRNILSTISYQSGRASGDQMREVHELLDQITGYLENHHAAAQGQGGALREIGQRLSALENRVDHSLQPY